MKINRIIRIIAAVTAAAAIISFTACGSSEASDSSQQSTQPESSVQTSETAETVETSQPEESEADEQIRSILNSGTAEDLVVAKPSNGAEGMEITFGEFLSEYRYYLESNGYDNDTDSSATAAFSSARQEIIDAIIEDRIVRVKFTEYGLTLSEEDNESIKSDVNYGIEQIKSGIRQTLYYADNTLTEEELTLQTDERFGQLLSDCGLTIETLTGWQEAYVMKSKLTAEVGKNVVYSFEDAQAEMQKLIDTLKASYESSPAEYYGQSYADIWVPDGSRKIQAILVGFDYDSYSQIQQLRGEDKDEEADAYREEKLADIQDRHDALMELISAGSNFEQLMTDYNEDEGNGTFLITPGTEVFGADFAECAMSMESPGEVASCVTDYGYYIVRYAEEVSVSEETLKASIEELQYYLLENKRSELFNAQYEQWLKEYAYETDAEVLGLD